MDDKNWRFPVFGEEGQHWGHKVLPLWADEDRGVKSIYCKDCKKRIGYLFMKNRISEADARQWTKCDGLVKEHKEIVVDQADEIMGLMVTWMKTNVCEEHSQLWKPKGEAFALDEDVCGVDRAWWAGEYIGMANGVLKSDCHTFFCCEASEIKAETLRRVDSGMGMYVLLAKSEKDSHVHVYAYEFDGRNYTPEDIDKWLGDHKIQVVAFQGAKGESEFQQLLDTKGGEEMKVVDDNKKVKPVMIEKTIMSGGVLKADKVKRIVYGTFLVPEKADHDGDVISAEDIEKVSHGFIAEYRTIDEMHKDIIRADIVESMIAWQDLDFHGKKLTKGTWFGGIKIHDEAVWNKIEAGIYKGFSVRIAGVREPIGEE